MTEIHYLTGIDVVGDICYTADESDGMEVFDVSDKSNPVKIGSYVPEYPQCWAVDVEDDLAYIANGNLGILILDISTPASPTKVYDSYDTYETFSCVDIQMQGNFIYTASNLDGFKIMDITNKTAPIIIIENGLGSMNRTSHIFLDGSYLYISEDDYGIEIYRVGDDQDGDNLTEYEEENIYGSDPYDEDSDDDGLLDDEEASYGTSLTDSDTDSDGIDDAYEIEFNLDPLVDDSALDGDEDGLTNLEEFIYNTDPWDADTDGDNLTDYEEVFTYLTDPLDPDCDDDGLDDREEVIVYETDPFDSDSDDDGLNDAEEVLTYLTDPWDADTDDDLFTDKEEVDAGTDPLDCDSHPMYLSIKLSIGISGFGVLTLLIVLTINIAGIIRSKKDNQ